MTTPANGTWWWIWAASRSTDSRGRQLKGVSRPSSYWTGRDDAEKTIYRKNKFEKSTNETQKTYERLSSFPARERSVGDIDAWKTYFFAGWDKPKSALATWIADRDDILAGEERSSRVAEPTVSTLDHNRRMHKRIVKLLRVHIPIVSRSPGVVLRVRGTLAKTLSARSLSIELQRIRSVFNVAVEEELIEHPPHYGTSFEKPPEKMIRKKRNQRGLQTFEADVMDGMQTNC